MAAKDYQLCVAALSGEVAIAKVSKRNKDSMTEDRKFVSKGEFIAVLMQWLENQLEDGCDTLVLTGSGKPIAEIKKLL